ncbi:MAG TPA: hypothetical protein VFB78_12700 [Acidimicrobiales bacterium]|nr:hypothetical protein [Acidimicrobiales bacterium]
MTDVVTDSKANTPGPRASGDAARQTPDWVRRYPPLLSLLIALLIAVIALPSSLNLPQPNPATTVELAPVPPTNEKPPPIGNVSELGLGQTSSLETGGALGGDLGSLEGDTSQSGGNNRRDKRCVGKPPRQTEDPLSPPCVAFFEGDNGGATYQGVDANEIRIVFYQDPGVYTPTPRGAENTPQNELIDLDAPPKPNEIGEITTRRYWAKYFEDRYQTYNRHPHLYIYYGNGGSRPEDRLADAAQVLAQVKPFATISSTGLSGGSDDFLEFMAQRGVLNFGSFSGRSQDFFNEFPKAIWGYPPSVEQMAKSYSSAVCKKVVEPGKVTFAGAGIPLGSPRRYGLLYTRDPSYPSMKKMADAIRTAVKACGANIVEEASFPRNGYQIDTETLPGFATQNMQKFQNAQVTTILWAGGVETKQSTAASQLGYMPEWVVLGDGLIEANNYGFYQAQQVWSHVWTFTPTVKEVPADERVCYNAYREVDGQAADSDVVNFACADYNDLRQLFTGIQVAGPKLGPFSIDKGFHAIPSIESQDPRLPACYYEPADYTCVKDAQAMYWDPSGIAPDAEDYTGCYRMAQGGKRYRPGTWPAGDINSMASPQRDDPCNAYTQTGYINNAPPRPE